MIEIILHDGTKLGTADSLLDAVNAVDRMERDGTIEDCTDVTLVDGETYYEMDAPSMSGLYEVD